MFSSKMNKKWWFFFSKTTKIMENILENLNRWDVKKMILTIERIDL